MGRSPKKQSGKGKGKSPKKRSPAKYIAGAAAVIGAGAALKYSPKTKSLVEQVIASMRKDTAKSSYKPNRETLHAHAATIIASAGRGKAVRRGKATQKAAATTIAAAGRGRAVRHGKAIKKSKEEHGLE